MTTDPDQDGPAACAAIALRRRLRSLVVGQTEAFDLLHYRFGARSLFAASITRGAGRLPMIAALLADVAWTNGDKSGHDGRMPPAAPEADAVRRVFRGHANPRCRPVMEPDQRDAVVAYLDALLAVVGECCTLDSHAPSATLGTEARRFVADFTKIREATLAA
jgi:hypothetical protein